PRCDGPAKLSGLLRTRFRRVPALPLCRVRAAKGGKRRILRPVDARMAIWAERSAPARTVGQERQRDGRARQDGDADVGAAVVAGAEVDTPARVGGGTEHHGGRSERGVWRGAGRPEPE